MAFTIPNHLLEHGMSGIHHHTIFLYYLRRITLRSEGESLVCLFRSSNSLAHFLSQHNTREYLRNLDDFYAQMTRDMGLDCFADGVTSHASRILLADVCVCISVTIMWWGMACSLHVLWICRPTTFPFGEQRGKMFTITTLTHLLSFEQYSSFITVIQ